MKKIYSTKDCLDYMMDSKNIVFDSEEDKTLFLKYLNVHGVNNVITVYKHYFCTNKNNLRHIYNRETNILEYKKKLDKDKKDANFIWDKIILVERLLKNEIYEQFIKQIKENNDLYSKDIYDYIINLCNLKIKRSKSENKKYYEDILRMIDKNQKDGKEFYFFIKELKWSNILSLILILDQSRRNEIYSKYNINFEILNYFRTLRNNIAHGDYLTIYLNKEIYDAEEYEKMEVINKMLKILKRNYTYSEQEIFELSEFYRKLKIDFIYRKQYI